MWRWRRITTAATTIEMETTHGRSRDSVQESAFSLSKPLIRRGFNKSAGCYDGAAVLQREIAERMLERLELVRLEPAVVVDVGCGTGVALPGLLRRYPRARVLALDLVPAMLSRARRRRHWWRRASPVCGDAETLPLADGSCDLLFSNLALPWCDLESSLKEFRRVLKPGGLLLFSTLGPDTLHELRESWRRVDDRVHVNAFFDMHDIGDALLRNGLVEPVMDTERLTLTFRRLEDLLRDVRNVGAGNATVGRPRGLTGKERLQALAHHYPRCGEEGLLPVTAEVVYGHAWGPTRVVPEKSRLGVATVPVSAIGRRQT